MQGFLYKRLFCWVGKGQKERYTLLYTSETKIEKTNLIMCNPVERRAVFRKLFADTAVRYGKIFLAPNIMAFVFRSERKYCGYFCLRFSKVKEGHAEVTVFIGGHPGAGFFGFGLLAEQRMSGMGVL